MGERLRACQYCGTTEISAKGVPVCALCSYQMRQVSAAITHAHRKKPRFCCDCGATLKGRGRSPRCVPCAAIWRQADQRDRASNYYRQNRKRVLKRETERIRRKRKNRSYRAKEREQTKLRMRRLRAEKGQR